MLNYDQRTILFNLLLLTDLSVFPVLIAKISRKLRRSIQFGSRA